MNWFYLLNLYVNKMCFLLIFIFRKRVFKIDFYVSMFVIRDLVNKIQLLLTLENELLRFE